MRIIFFSVFSIYFIIARANYQTKIQLLKPLSRTSVGSEKELPPCGDSYRSPISLIASEGSIIEIDWIILKLKKEKTTCSIHIFEENNFIKTTLIPLLKQSDEKGIFPCGEFEDYYYNSPYLNDKEKNRDKTTKYYFHKEKVKIPINFTCETCVLQIILHTDNGNYYQCSDITVNSISKNNLICSKPCLNSGYCSNGKCYCLKGFSGKLCQKNLNNFDVMNFNIEYSTTLKYVFIIITFFVFAIALAIGVYICKKKQNEEMKKKIFNYEQQITQETYKNTFIRGYSQFIISNPTENFERKNTYIN